MKALRLILQILLPLVILGGCVLFALWISSQKPEPKVTADTFSAPMVRVHAVTVEDLLIEVEARGVVEPFRAIDLAAQVGGQVTAVSPALRAGGFFAEKEVLVSIDRSDYDLAVFQQEAAVARAELRLLQERAEAESALQAWRELEGREPDDPLVRREPQIADAEKALAAAKAQLRKSRLDLLRTEVTAPFAGRVRAASVDIGQIVQPGAPLAKIYGTAFAEVRLPLPTRETAFLDLPLHRADRVESGRGPDVELTAEFGGRSHTYPAHVVRTEGEIDRRTRQMTLIARIDDPYSQGDEQQRPPLAIGTFVHATIRGRTFGDVATVPRGALVGEDEVWVIRPRLRLPLLGWLPAIEGDLERRHLTVLRATDQQIFVRAGLAPGEWVCTTRLDAPVEGMPVRLLAEPAQ